MTKTGKRRQHSDKFKAMVALEAIKDVKTVTQFNRMSQKQAVQPWAAEN